MGKYLLTRSQTSRIGACVCHLRLCPYVANFMPSSSVSYSIFGNEVEAGEFRSQLARASEDIRNFFEDNML